MKKEEVEEVQHNKLFSSIWNIFLWMFLPSSQIYSQYVKTTDELLMEKTGEPEAQYVHGPNPSCEL